MRIKPNVIFQKVMNMDWFFGYNNPVDKSKFTNNWWGYKPTDETQRYSKFDPWDCTSRSPANILEFGFNYKVKNNLFSERAISFLNGKNCLNASYFDKNGSINFLDKFNAILSGTIPGKGNSFRRPADVMRNFGMVPESAFDWDKYGYKINATEYYDEKSIEFLKPLGEEFLEIFQLNYEVVYQKDFHKAIWYSPIEVGVNAWTRKGQYYVNNGYINHATVIANIPNHFEIFDSYSPFIKNLSPDYDFMDYGYIWFVTEKRNNMILKDKCRYVSIGDKKKEYGFAKNGKLIVGDRDEILNLFIDETGGDIKNKVITVLENDFYGVPHYNTKLELIKK